MRLESLALVILRLGLLLAFPVHPICTLQSGDSRNARGWTDGPFRDNLEDRLHLVSKKILGKSSTFAHYARDQLTNREVRDRCPTH